MFTIMKETTDERNSNTRKERKVSTHTSRVGVKMRTHDCVGRGTDSIWDFRKYLDTSLRHKRILTSNLY